MPRPPAGARAADWLGALERRKQLASGGTKGGGRVVKMAAVVEVEVGGGAAGERELDEVRRVQSQGGKRRSLKLKGGEESKVLGEAGP